MKPPKSRVKPHLFELDPEVPGCCARCHLPGEPGDAHHTLPDRPAEADARERAAGESGGAE